MLNYIIENSAWIVTFIVIEVICMVINHVWMKRDRKARYDLKRQATVGIIESAILLAAIVYAGAPAWLVWTIVVLAVISVGSVMMLKWKYSL